MAYETILYEVAGDVATITLNRPDKLNAWNSTMAAELADSLRAADANPATRVIILTGAGRAFCAGADIGGFAKNIGNRESGSSDGGFQPVQPMTNLLTYVVRGLSKPSIVAINGYALGVGFTMTLPFDVRIASENAKVGAIFGRVGLVAELGSSFILPRLVGASRAAEMMLTGRHFSASECLAMGLVTHVTAPSELLPKAREIAAEMALCSPVSLAYTRRLLSQGIEGTLESTMQLEMLALEHCAASAEHKEYVSAFVEKRKPNLKRVRS
ncbi:MAG TPA: enoyl-CoA hydratase [Candidatus Binataceae bacterium]|nr:enoyl-CoA hydratase [Candidatus Binataceae bacterium]